MSPHNVSSDLCGLDALDLAGRLRRREVGCVEATRAYLDRIAAFDATIGAFLHVRPEEALSEAEAAQRTLDAAAKSGGAVPAFCGVPVALKDNLCTKGIPTTCASKILAGYLPPYDATAVAKVHASGAVVLGKLNMDEFAMGSSNENSSVKPVRNPWDASRVPGGSSGGSAAAVAADFAAFTLGSDTGGSIRLPAAFCGVVGLKPTYGSVSRYGLVAFASSLDQIGPLTRSVADAEAVFGLLAGRDPHDATTVDRPASAAGKRAVKGLRVGIPKEFLTDAVQPEVRAAVKRAAAWLATEGAECEECSLPAVESWIPAYYIVSSAEASSNLARFDGVRYGHRATDYDSIASMYSRSRSEGFGAEVKRRILLGTFVLSAGYHDAYYGSAQKARAHIRSGFDGVFAKYDLLLGPVAPQTAFRLGEKSGDPLQMYLQDICTVGASLAGLPALSVPAGFDASGLPIGMHLTGPAFSEETLFAAAGCIERAADCRVRRPDLSAAAACAKGA